MSPRSPRRLALAGAALAAGATSLLGAVGPASTPAEARGVGAMPLYTVHAIQFRAVDETGTDWLGADEVYVGAQTSSGAKVVHTKLWSGVDTGDTRQIPATQQCLSDSYLTVDHRDDGRPAGYQNDEWQCVGAPSIDLEVDMWEKEGDYNPWDFDPKALGTTRLHNQDEHIGRVDLQYPASELKLILDQPGESFTWDQHLQANGHYTLTLRVQRIR